MTHTHVHTYSDQRNNAGTQAYVAMLWVSGGSRQRKDQDRRAERLNERWGIE